MTMGVISDGVMAGCHVVGKVPALGLAICLAAATGASTGTMPAGLSAPEANRCVTGSTRILVDLEATGYKDVLVGTCLANYRIIPINELMERCKHRKAAKHEEICRQF